MLVNSNGLSTPSAPQPRSQPGNPLKPARTRSLTHFDAFMSLSLVTHDLSHSP
jgi:hypothetical protein